MKPLAAALSAALAALGGCRERAPGQAGPSMATGTAESTVASSASVMGAALPSSAGSCRGYGNPLRCREGHGGRARDGNPSRLRGLHDPSARCSARPRAVRRGDRRDRAPREAHDDLGPGQRGLAGQRGRRSGAGRREPGDVRRHPRGAPRERDQRAGRSTSRSKHCTGSGSSIRISTHIRRPRRPCALRSSTSDTGT